MLYLLQSNQMESLSQQLAAMLATAPGGANPLAQEAILVQSPGMSTWLRLEIAKYNGIAAALEFPLPSSFTWQLCHELLPDVPKENAFTKAAMTWKLMALLPDLLDDEAFKPLRHYLTPDVVEPPDAELKLYQLCGRIADIFDQYLVYRPDWILGWERNESPLKLGADQTWQPLLWRALTRFNAQVLAQSGYHRANLHQALLEALGNQATSLAALPQRLFVFGISSMAPQTLEVIYHLARRIDVVMLSLSPCQHYWGDIVDPRQRARMALQYADKKQLAEHWQDKLEVGNPLLANNGKMGRELLDLLLELPAEHTDFGYDLYRDPGVDSLLHGVQHDILEMETLGQSLGPDAELYLNLHGRRPLASDDDSITLRSCHSPLREVETLHDHLLALLEQDPGLQPRDIVVMMPDVAAYAPYIDAVFAAKQGQHYIAYAIADRGAAQESPLINSFLHLLGIHQSRFGLTDIISILEVPAVLRRFDLLEEELQLIRRWLDSAGVRWGRDEQSRVDQGLAAFGQNSWAFGIRRLILGYALSDDAPLYQQHLSVEGIEGQAAQALGKLLNFIERLDQLQQQLSVSLDSRSRLVQLEQMLADFYAVDEDERPQLQEIREALVKLGTELDDAGQQADLGMAVLQHWFGSQLNESRVGQRYLAGSVNFCTLMPMRSIPFGVVCLLGMNDGVYPRVQHPVGFDLMAHQGARKGDRSRRLDDRYLFLEALLSARRQLYISYLGHSERDNSERIPSMLVSELIEYCQLCYLPQGLTPKVTPQDAEAALWQHLVCLQPLQPFDERLYLPKGAESDQNDSAVSTQSQRLQPSYSRQWCPAGARDATEPPFMAADAGIDLSGDDELLGEAAETDGEAQQIELSALVRFFRNPAQYFFNRSLKVDLGLKIQAENNDEAFSLNALERYQLQLKLLDDAIGHNSELIDGELLERLKAGGSLPMAPFDNLLLHQYQRDLAPLIGRSLYLRGEAGKTRHLDIRLKLTSQDDGKGITLVGRIEDLAAKGLVNYRPGTAHGRDLVRLYLRHLCVNAMGHGCHSYLLDVGHFHALAPLSQEMAKANLTQLLALFIQGQQRPLCFMPRTSLAYAEAEGDHQQRLLAAKEQWLDEQSQLGEAMEPHYQRLFSFPRDFSEQEFGGLALAICTPLLSLYHKDPLAKLGDYVDNAGGDNVGIDNAGIDTSRGEE
ncbi:exodeoxyribonuclease V subunit gamma [Shewanella sp. AS16]|uniref:exodeoxyribonuclease V subunit gamma n=1 Tax=Shewanella sp. AS16 TaxID=2907625 RepID=UPI001F2FE368|nr:exodeoxyribonuclease V subunit gamma [Shewanella sp. AS16]MCE9687433.1 exodeoxyribonuclease V subunit gamma [Shewanella sp. AS16]